jgi:hypothetical protein
MFSVSKLSWVGVAVVVLFGIGCGEPYQAVEIPGGMRLSAQDLEGCGDFPAAMACADFNGDGQIDLAVANPEQGGVSVFLGQEDGTLASEVIFPVEGGSALEAQDADADGWVDLAVTNEAGGAVQVLYGHGPGGFSPAVPSES